MAKPTKKERNVTLSFQVPESLVKELDELSEQFSADPEAFQRYSRSLTVKRLLREALAAHQAKTKENPKK